MHMNAFSQSFVMLGSVLAIVGCAERSVSYNNEVKPFMERYCLRCHGEGGQGSEASGFRLDSYEALMKGTKFGPVVKPGDSFTSALVMLVEGRADPSLKMPHDQGEKPSEEEIEVVKTWIDQGAANN